MLSVFIFPIIVSATAIMSLDEAHRTRKMENLSIEDATHSFEPPRTKTRSPSFIFHLLKHKLKHPTIEKVPTTADPIANCICVPYYQCNANNTIITDGAGNLDPRCTGDLEVCCRLPTVPIVIPTTMSPVTQPPTTPSTRPPTTPSTRPPTTPSTIPPTTPSTIPPTTPSTRPPTTPSTRPPTTPSTRPPTTPSTRPPTTPSTIPPTTPSTIPPTRPPTNPPTLPPTTLPPLMNCVCVPAAQCSATGFINVGGEGIINPRQTLNPCPIAGQICCQLPTTAITIPTVQPLPPTTPPFTVSPPIVQPIPCACVQFYQCDTNGYIIVSGAGVIDPRFPIGRQGQGAGTCASPILICCKIPPIGQDSAIGFPAGNKNQATSTIRYPGTAQACMCVKTWQCSAGNAVSPDGAGIIDPRFGLCPLADEICCRVQGIVRNLPGVAASVINRELSPIGNALIVNPQPSTTSVCGIRGTTCFSSQTCATKPGETSFAEFPWMVALLIRKPDGTSHFQCGASMINTRAILTAAHCVIERPSGVLIARFGEWNTANDNEPAPIQEAQIQTIITHPQYYNGGLYNDVAVLILATPVTYAVNVMPICMPQQGMAFNAGVRCWATGWGRSGFEGQYQTILKKIDLPIIDRSDCQNRLRATRLGQYFQLHGSFVCAGGEASKDTCRGDGGGPLVCPTATGQLVQAGIVSWGIGCGESNTPAVYASVSLYRQWIDQQLVNYGVL